MNKKCSKLYGFEDYSLYRLVHTSLLSCSSTGAWGIRFYGYDCSTLFIANNIPVNIDFYGNTKTDSSILSDHPELLNDTGKVYVHPSCTISRSLLYDKYSKSLDPWKSDVIVIPDTDVSLNEHDVFGDMYAIFINEDKKMIFYYSPGCKEESNICRTLVPDITVQKAMTGVYTDSLDEVVCQGITVRDIMQSQFMYYGKVLNIGNKGKYVLDALTGMYPKDKTVFETTILESLTSEDNKITFENLVGIAEMLDSNDDDSVGAAIKALSMMNYVNYSNSIKYILNKVNSNYRYNPASKTTSAKFMMSFLGVSRRAWLCYDECITEDDFLLFKRLMEYYESKSNRSINDRLKEFAFMTINLNGLLVPKIKKAAYSPAV